MEAPAMRLAELATCLLPNPPLQQCVHPCTPRAGCTVQRNAPVPHSPCSTNTLSTQPSAVMALASERICRSCLACAPKPAAAAGGSRQRHQVRSVTAASRLHKASRGLGRQTCRLRLVIGLYVRRCSPQGVSKQRSTVLLPCALGHERWVVVRCGLRTHVAGHEDDARGGRGDDRQAAGEDGGARDEQLLADLWPLRMHGSSMAAAKGAESGPAIPPAAHTVAGVEPMHARHMCPKVDHY